MDDFELEIKTEFIKEALMNLEEAESAFMELETSSERAPLLDRIFRLAHNMKGGSRAVGFGQVAEFTHQLENLVLKLKNKELELAPEIVTTLLKSNDRLIEMLSGLKTNLDATFVVDDLISEIESWLNGTGQIKPVSLDHHSETPSESEVQSEVLEDLVASSPDVEPPSLEAFDLQPPPPIPETPAMPVSPPAAKEAPTQETAKKASDDEVIRVPLNKIDLLNDFVGELIVLQAIVQQQVQQQVLRSTYSASAPRSEAQKEADQKAALMNATRQVAKLSKNIQGLSMSLRMLPVKPMIQKLQRVVRDTAKAIDKDVDLVVEGEGLEIDKSVLDQIGDPLIHIVRNAVDHGLEKTDMRLAAGKSRNGKVMLSFANEGNHLLVTVSDDGAGMDPEILRQKGIEKGLIKPSEELTEKQLIHLIFHPGFSTKAVTSEISGRGVGMDVVKTNVEKIGGQIEIQTKLGSGSQFTLKIPLSLAVVDGLVVLSENNRYVIPLSQVNETVNLKTHKIHEGSSGIETCFQLRGTVIPLISIDGALSGRKIPIDPNATSLIVHVNDKPVGLTVTDIVRSQQIVIKPLKNGIKAQPGWIGSCVLGDGMPTLIISPAELLDGWVTQTSHTDSGKRSA